VIAGLVAYPTAYAIYLSMLNRRMDTFVWFLNYEILIESETFWLVAWQSCLFAVTAVVAKALIGFWLAHMLHNIPTKGQRKWRGMLLVPWVIPPALSTLGWWWMFDPTYSSINWLLAVVAIPPVPWLGDHLWARTSVIIVNVWYGAPFFMIMYLAALKSVPEQLYEAAAIDGATGWQRLRYVTLPMMRNIISITVLFSLIVTFANYDIVRVLTNGGPRDLTHLFATYAFQVGILSGNIPRGAAVSLFMLPLLAVFAFFILRGVNQRNKEMA
jgi:multiple sugar transport system permease protein